MISQSTALTKEIVELAEKTGTLEAIYGQEVNRLIRLEVSQSEENAIYRHKLNGTGDEEFEKFDAFCERCKVTASEVITKYLNEIREEIK
jgi:hypothetical protein